jgi:ribose/xylose/arabinose/galactoside ABC-type transport system permease subunit
MNGNQSRQRLILTILKNTPTILFVVIFVAFSLLDHRFFARANFENIIASSAFVGILAVGMTFVLLTGGIDLSVGANMYITGAILAMMLVNGYPLWLSILTGMLAGTAIGFFNGFLISKMKIIPFMVTLGTLTAGRGLALLVTQSAAINVTKEMPFAAARVVGVPLPIFVFLALVFVAFIVLNYTAPGRQLYAMGNDPEAAKKAGLNVTRLTMLAYIVCGFCAALATVIALSQQGRLSASFGEGVEFRAIAAAVLGGTSLFGGVGAVFPGTLIGTLLVQMISNGLVYLQVDLYLQDMISPLVIFFAVFVDAQRMNLIKRLERRNIRVESTAGQAPVAKKIRAVI